VRLGAAKFQCDFRHRQDLAPARRCRRYCDRRLDRRGGMWRSEDSMSWVLKSGLSRPPQLQDGN
jgi:hypothetical protein